MKQVAGLTLAVGIALAPYVAQAQDAWPNRTITFVVPYAAGGYTDLVGRLTARYVEKALGKLRLLTHEPREARHVPRVGAPLDQHCLLAACKRPHDDLRIVPTE